jgi:hypothetical protein
VILQYGGAQRQSRIHRFSCPALVPLASECGTGWGRGLRDSVARPAGDVEGGFRRSYRTGRRRGPSGVAPGMGECGVSSKARHVGWLLGPRRRPRKTLSSGVAIRRSQADPVDLLGYFAGLFFPCLEAQLRGLPRNTRKGKPSAGGRIRAGRKRGRPDDKSTFRTKTRREQRSEAKETWKRTNTLKTSALASHQVWDGMGAQEVGTKSGLGTEPLTAESWAGAHSLSSLRQHQASGRVSHGTWRKSVAVNGGAVSSLRSLLGSLGNSFDEFYGHNRSQATRSFLF